MASYSAPRPSTDRQMAADVDPSNPPGTDSAHGDADSQCSPNTVLDVKFVGIPELVPFESGSSKSSETSNTSDSEDSTSDEPDGWQIQLQHHVNDAGVNDTPHRMHMQRATDDTQQPSHRFARLTMALTLYSITWALSSTQMPR